MPVSGIIVQAVCDVNKKVRDAKEYLVVNGEIDPYPLCEQSKSKQQIDNIIRRTVFEGDTIAIWTDSSGPRKHGVTIYFYEANLTSQ
jgi:hypothetical protein